VHTLILASAPQQGGGTTDFQLWGVPIITGIVFYLLGVATTVYLKRPKLAIAGSGSGGSGSPTGFQQHDIRVQNTPGRLGVKVGENTLFGHRINRQHWFGWPVMREPAKGCTANLYDESGAHITALWWRDPDDSGKKQIRMDLDSGQVADLLLFAQRNDDVPNYYPYIPGTDTDPTVPPVKLNGTRRFIVRLSYSDGQQHRDYKYTVSTDYQYGRIQVRPKWRR
jgi:hypothetical protein